jgi:hypothetical protein
MKLHNACYDIVHIEKYRPDAFLSESHSLRSYHARKPCKAQPAEKFRYNAQPPAHWGMERITVCILVVDPYRRHRIMHHSNP